MKFIEYLKTQLPSSWIYSEEQNLNWDGENTLLILKSQTGTSYRDSKVIPFQICVFTNSPIEVKGILDVFSQTLTNTYYVNGLETWKQSYFTSIIPTIATPSGNQLTSQVIMTGTLVVSTSVSDIKKVEIDNVEYETTQRNLTYTANIESSAKISTERTKANMNSNSLILTFNMINKNNTFCNSLSSIRTKNTSGSTTFSVKLTFSANNTTETYTMMVTGFSLVSENPSLPVIQVTMMEA